MLVETDFTERRRHIRVYFEGYEELQCRFTGNGRQDAALQAAVLDISLGGIHLAVDGQHHFAVGDKLTLVQLQFQQGSPHAQQVTMEIRWVFARQDFSKVMLAVSFSICLLKTARLSPALSPVKSGKKNKAVAPPETVASGKRGAVGLKVFVTFLPGCEYGCR